MLCPHCLSILLILIGHTQSVVLRSYVEIGLPEGAFQVTDTVSNVALRSQCDVLAWNRGKYVFKYDKASKTCEIGWADTAGIWTGGPDKMYIRDYPHVGLLQGNNFDDPGFTVLLPNGVTCPDHPLPNLPFFSPQSEDQPEQHGMVEIDGILYMGGGKLASGPTGAFKKIDLKSSTPSWMDLPNIPNPGTISGMVGYTNADAKTRIFLVRLDTEERVNAQGTTPIPLDMYDLSSNKWFATGPILKSFGVATVVDGRWLILAGGFIHIFGDLKRVQVFDMENPDKDAVVLSEPLPLARYSMGCAMTNVLRGERGLLCVCGHDNGVGDVRDVQFLPLRDGKATGPGRVLTNQSPVARRLPHLMAPSPYEHIIVGGSSSPYYSLEAFDRTSEEFKPITPQLPVNLRGSAYAEIDSKLVIEQCGKYLK